MKKLFYSISMLSALIVTSCSSDEITNSTSTPPIEGATNVYTVGTYTDDLYQPHAFITVNGGAPTYLSGLTEASRANAVYVVNNDVYVAGDNSGSNPLSSACYWKNGVVVALEGNNAEAHDICVQNNDVYVSGIDSNSNPVYWKNGIKTVLSSLTSSKFSKHKIKVIGNDVYVNGDVYPAVMGPYVAVYWKNGVMNTLNTGSATSYSSTAGIDVDTNNQVYVAGLVFHIGPQQGTFRHTYWKNGVEMPYSGGEIRSIKVDGTDVYVCGQTNDAAAYWKNGIMTSLSPNEHANEIAVLNSDVYVTGMSDNQVQNLCVWKNSVLTLGLERSEGRDIFVVQN